MSEITIKEARRLKKSLYDLIGFVEYKTKPNNTKDQTVNYKIPKRCSGCAQQTYIIHRHHVVPISLGGIDEQSNIIEICEECHNKIHGLKFLQHGELIKNALKKKKLAAQQNGTDWRCGRPRLDPSLSEQVSKLRQEGVSVRQIAKRVGIGKTSVERILRGKR